MHLKIKNSLPGGYIKKQNLVKSFLIRQLMRGRKCVHVAYLIIYLIVITFVSSITHWRSSFLSDSGAPPSFAPTYYAHFIFIYWHSKIRTDPMVPFEYFGGNTD